jgi:hypothetical protein
LTIIENVPIRDGVVNLMLDPRCLEKYNSDRFREIKLRQVQDYHCCEHVLYCPFTCSDKNFFVRAIPPDTGIPLGACPFHDGGCAYTDQAN